MSNEKLPVACKGCQAAYYTDEPDECFVCGHQLQIVDDEWIMNLISWDLNLDLII